MDMNNGDLHGTFSHSGVGQIISLLKGMAFTTQYVYLLIVY